MKIAALQYFMSGVRVACVPRTNSYGLAHPAPKVRPYGTVFPTTRCSEVTQFRRAGFHLLTRSSSSHLLPRAARGGTRGGLAAHSSGGERPSTPPQ